MNYRPVKQTDDLRETFAMLLCPKHALEFAGYAIKHDKPYHDDEAACCARFCCGQLWTHLVYFTRTED